MRIAAFTTPTFALLGVGSEEWARHYRVKPYLESKGIKIPRRKLVERVTEIDADNWILLGMGLGTAAAGLMRRPWHIHGWNRFMGYASYGGLAGLAGALLSDPEGYTNALDKAERNRAISMAYQADMQQFWASRRTADDVQKNMPQPQVGMTPLEKLLQQAGSPRVEGQEFGKVEAVWEGDVGHDSILDREDPQPHYSFMRDGERIYLPSTNYEWQPGPEGVKQVEDHINVLKAQRAQLAREAELLWHQLAVKEAEYFDTPVSTESRKEQEDFVSMLSHIHFNIWNDVSALDWTIADSNKILLQMKAMEKRAHWTPPAPANEAKIAPRQTYRLLQGLEADLRASVPEIRRYKEEYMNALNDAGVRVINGQTGQQITLSRTDMEKTIEETSKLLSRVEAHIEELQKMTQEIEERIGNAER